MGRLHSGLWMVFDPPPCDEEFGSATSLIDEVFAS